MKQRFNRGRPANSYFWRDKSGNEVDCLIDEGGSLLPIEIKAGRTITQDYFKGSDYFSRLAAGRTSKPCIVYGGDTDQERSNARVLSWRSLDKLW